MAKALTMTTMTQLVVQRVKVAEISAQWACTMYITIEAVPETVRWFFSVLLSFDVISVLSLLLFEPIYNNDERIEIWKIKVKPNQTEPKPASVLRLRWPRFECSSIHTDSQLCGARILDYRKRTVHTWTIYAIQKVFSFFLLMNLLLCTAHNQQRSTHICTRCTRVRIHNYLCSLFRRLVSFRSTSIARMEWMKTTKNWKFTLFELKESCYRGIRFETTIAPNNNQRTDFCFFFFVFRFRTRKLNVTRVVRVVWLVGTVISSMRKPIDCVAMQYYSYWLFCVFLFVSDFPV